MSRRRDGLVAPLVALIAATTTLLSPAAEPRSFAPTGTVRLASGLRVRDGRTLHQLDELPMLGRSTIGALAADPAHPDGAIAAVEGCGVVFVRIEGR